MRDELLHLYERELGYLRRSGAEFARQYPKVAGRLLLEPTKCDDPHVERILEGFAFLAARIHLRIQDDFSEFSEGLLNVVYPQFVRPIPSLSIAEFQLDPEQGRLTAGFEVPAGTQLYTRPAGGATCRFRTCYDTTLWPIDVTSAKWLSPHELLPPVRAPEAVAALRVELACAADMTFDALEIDSLRLHIRAEPTLASTLYEVLCNNCTRILARTPGRAGEAREPASLRGDALRPVGFAEEEGLLPVPRRAFVGYRLLQEYFAFPDKFYFLDLGGFDETRVACPGNRLELVFLVSAFERRDRAAQLESGVARDTLRLGCTPVVNLFPRTSEPILLTHRTPEYRIVPDARRRASTGIYSVEEVMATSPGSEEVLKIEPFRSFRHAGRGAGGSIASGGNGAPAGHGESGMYWTALRRHSGWSQGQDAEIHLSFTDLSARVVHPEAEQATARLLCHNRDLPARLPFGNPKGDFEMPGGGPIRSITALQKPTEPIYPPLGRPQLWRLLSQLSLNYVSLTERNGETLRELLRLHNPGTSPAADRQIRGILSVTGEPCYGRVESEHGLAFARGHRVEIAFDEEEFAGAGVYLLASILERFLGMSVSLNSFCVLAARTRQRKEMLKQWRPRSGYKVLL